jgi:15-cis-phytoene synthase
MNPSSQAIRASYAACRRLSRQAGSSFPAAFLLLPRGKRRAMYALYAFSRHSDDLADNPQPEHLPQESLYHWRAALEHALLGCYPRFESRQRLTGFAAASSPLLGLYDMPDEIGAALLPAVADTVRRFEIPPEHLRAVLDGVEMDLRQRRYETFDELTVYCRRVASAVGLACLHVWGFEGPEAFEPACQAGIALQLTNILRDVKEDLDADRVYLPLEDLRECGYSLDELRQGVVNAPFLRLMELQIGRAEECYRQASELMRWLEPDGRRIFGVMVATYHALLAQIKRRPGDVFSRRIELSWARKLRIAARWTLLTPSAAALA